MQNCSASSESGCAMTPVLRPEPRPRFRRGPVSGGTTQWSIVVSGFLAGVPSPRSLPSSGIPFDSCACRLKAPPDGRTAASQPASDLAQRKAFPLKRANCWDIDLDSWTAEFLPPGSRALEASCHALTNDVALELGHRTDDGEHRL